MEKGVKAHKNGGEGTEMGMKTQRLWRMHRGGGEETEMGSRHRGER